MRQSWQLPVHWGSRRLRQSDNMSKVTTSDLMTCGSGTLPAALWGMCPEHCKHTQEATAWQGPEGSHLSHWLRETEAQRDKSTSL